MDLHLNDKSALVTGSTAGIGLEIARKLAVEGAKVIITGRNKSKLDQAVDSIRTSGGAYVSGVLADAATEEKAPLPLCVRRRTRTSLSTISASMR
jgi:short-subunit dehydrogenase